MPVTLAYFLEEKTEEINRHLEKLIPEQRERLYSSLFQAARYTIQSGGKRMRPILAIATAEALGCPKPIPLTPPCILELIHTYSLIHDDLPAMDDDDLRRGQPALHKAYTEGHAILTGDYLLTASFEILANTDEISDDKKLDCIRTIAHHMGGHGMIGGQVLDLLFAGKPIDHQTLRVIHINKTAAPIMAAVEVGAILAGVPQNHREAIKLFGQQAGLVYQIIDDILDVTAKEKELGKPIGSDQASSKTTYVSMLGVDEARKSAKFLLEQALETLKELPYDTSILESLAIRIFERNS